MRKIIEKVAAAWRGLTGGLGGLAPALQPAPVPVYPPAAVRRHRR